MQNFTKEIYSSSIAQFVRMEYRNLLAVKISDKDAEQIIINHCMDNIEPNSVEEAHFWLALALCQWEHSRLSEQVKACALNLAHPPIQGISDNALTKLVETLQTPMPSRKQVRMPSWVKKCPWNVGSLLAYRIISSTNERVCCSPYWGKYVLLKIVAILQSPVAQLAPHAACSESMIVGLYNWCGSEIPNKSIVKSLEPTPISVYGPSLAPSDLALIGRIIPSGLPQDQVEALVAQTKARVEMYCCLDWKCAKGISSNEVFTYLGDDLNDEEVIKDALQISAYSFAHSIPFDAMLVNRLSQIENRKVQPHK